MPKLNLVESIAAWDDIDAGNNPALKFVDWRRSVLEIDIEQPQSRGYRIAPGQTLAVFNGTRTLAVDGTTSFSVGLVTGATDRYRFRWIGGTNPAFRTDRALNLATHTATIAVNQDQTVIFSTNGSVAGVLVGDTIWIPGADESITSPFHEGNQGFWVVLAVQDSQHLVLTRDGAFSAYTGDTAVAVSAANQVRAFSPDGVQVGDVLVVTAGFAATTQRTYAAVSVTSTYLEVESTVAIPAETAITPGAAGFKAFSDAKRYLRVESDQEVAVTLSSEATARTVVPWSAGDNLRPGWLEVCGPVYALSIANKSSQTAKVTVLSGE